MAVRKGAKVSASAEVAVFWDPTAGPDGKGRWVVRWGRTRAFNFHNEGPAREYAKSLSSAKPGNPGVRVMGA